MSAAMGLALLSGLVAGSAFGGAVLALGVLTRAMTAFGSERTGAGWALALGAAWASLMYMGELALGAGAWLGAVLLLGGGVFVGMTSAALAELLELLPALLVRSRVAGMALPAVAAVMLGKALGAVLGSLNGW